MKQNLAEIHLHINFYLYYHSARVNVERNHGIQDFPTDREQEQMTFFGITPWPEKIKILPKYNITLNLLPQ